MKALIQDTQEVSNEFKIPLVLSSVSAGFPSPADDYIEGQLDIHKHLVKKPASTIFLKAPDDAMNGDGIFQGDLMVVDQSLKPTNNKVIVAEIDGNRIVRRMLIKHGRVFLTEGKNKSSAIEISPDMNFDILGVVTYVIHYL
jgi:DNA polymerase V